MRPAILTHTGDGRKGTAQLEDLEKILSLMLTLSRLFPNMTQSSFIHGLAS